MSERATGGPAFPRLIGFHFDLRGGSPNTYFTTQHEGGMTLRDWFAGQALHQMLTDPHFSGNIQSNKDFVNVMARQAYRYADAMLVAREQKERE